MVSSASLATVFVATAHEHLRSAIRDAAVEANWRQVVCSHHEIATLIRETSNQPLIVVLDWLEEPAPTWALLRHIRSLPQGRNGAVVVVIPRVETGAVDAALEAGADDFIEPLADPECVRVRLATSRATALRKIATYDERHSRHSFEHTYHELLHHLPCGVYESSPDGRFLKVNDILRRILGYDTIEEVLQLDISDDVFVDRRRREELVSRIVDTGFVADEELVVRRKDGRPIVLLESAFAKRDAQGRIQSFVGTVTDITGRAEALENLQQKQVLLEGDLSETLNRLAATNAALGERNRELEQAQRELELTEHRFRHLVESLSEGVFQCDSDGTLVYASPAFTSVFGADPESILGRRWSDFIHPNDLPAREQNIARILAGEPVTSEFRLMVHPSQTREVRCASSPTMVDGQLVGFQGIVSDISESRRAERLLNETHTELQRRNQFLEALLDALPNAVHYKDVEGRYLGCNRAFEEAVGMRGDDVIGRTFREVFGDESAGEFEARDAELLMTGGSSIDETTVRIPGRPEARVVFSRCVFHDEHGAPAGILGVSTDVTRLRSLEDRLRHAEKMEALGQFAGSIAHDFNNLVMVIRGTAQLMARQLRPDDPFRNDLDLILDTTRTASDLSRSLLSFARRQVLDKVNLDIAEVVGSLRTMLSRLLHPGVDLVMDELEPEALVVADRSSVERMIVNLVVNARDAVGDDGTITIRVSSTRFDADLLRLYPWAEPGDYVTVEVSDDGIGMAPEVLERAFDPFFTTKRHERGTGLGLSSVYGGAKQHDGYVIIDSEPGWGTSVSIHLPRCESASRHPKPPESNERLRTATETVLVVEDEDDLRRVVVRFLESLGYRTLDAANGREALEILDRHGAGIHAVITDLVMPEVNGLELLSSARTHWPHLGFVLCSGNRGRFEDSLPIVDDGVARLEKPFDIEDVASRLEEVLESSGVIRLPESLLED